MTLSRLITPAAGIGKWLARIGGGLAYPFMSTLLWALYTALNHTMLGPDQLSERYEVQSYGFNLWLLVLLPWAIIMMVGRIGQASGCHGTRWLLTLLPPLVVISYPLVGFTPKPLGQVIPVWAVAVLTVLLAEEIPKVLIKMVERQHQRPCRPTQGQTVVGRFRFSSRGSRSSTNVKAASRALPDVGIAL